MVDSLLPHPRMTRHAGAGSPPTSSPIALLSVSSVRRPAWPGTPPVARQFGINHLGGAPPSAACRPRLPLRGDRLRVREFEQLRAVGAVLREDREAHACAERGDSGGDA